VIAPIRAITLDLDDTLWPFAPIGERIETALQAWFQTHSPRTAERFPIAEMRALRERVMAELPELSHDLGLLRRLTIERALRESGDDPELASAAYGIFFRERNQVDFFADALYGLRRIAAQVPVAALTNGNADLTAIGISQHFQFELTAREYGAPKPNAGIFLEACQRLGTPPEPGKPTTALATGDERAEGAIRWVLDVKAPLPGTDFYAIFAFVVRPQWRG